MEGTPKPAATAAGFKNWLTALMCILLAALAVCLVALSYMKKNEARVLLGQCKTIELAVYAVSAQHRGAGQPFYDGTRPDGMAEGCADEVLELAECYGRLTIEKWDTAAQEPMEMMYAEQDFIAVYKGGENAGWSIYRFEQLFLND